MHLIYHRHSCNRIEIIEKQVHLFCIWKHHPSQGLLKLHSSVILPYPITSHRSTKHFILSHVFFFFFFEGGVLSFSFLLRPWVGPLTHPFTYPYTPQNQRHSYLVPRFMLTNYLYLPIHTLLDGEGKQLINVNQVQQWGALELKSQQSTTWRVLWILANVTTFLSPENSPINNNASLRKALTQDTRITTFKICIAYPMNTYQMPFVSFLTHARHTHPDRKKKKTPTSSNKKEGKGSTRNTESNIPVAVPLSPTRSCPPPAVRVAASRAITHKSEIEYNTRDKSYRTQEDTRNDSPWTQTQADRGDRNVVFFYPFFFYVCVCERAESCRYVKRMHLAGQKFM